MKKVLFLFICILSIQSVNGQKSVNKFIDKMKKHKSAYAITLPGWLLRTGIKVADEEELRYESGFQEIVDGIKQLRILFINDKPNMKSSEIRSIVNKIKEKDGYVDYATVKNEDANVHVIVKEDKEKVKSLVILASSNDGFTILNLKTDINMQDLKSANLSFNDKTNHNNHKGHNH